ncbi:MAG: helix-turn-helix domain-containing protein [Candidatus Gracilibacteria bacterium]|jgi:sugar-specific transcriptional regulator TrmB
MKQLVQTLQEFGLNQKEAETYCVLLSIGTNAASTIARKAAINRSSCYNNLEKLIHKGFVQQIIKSNVNYFSAIEPNLIMEKMKGKQYDLQSKIDHLGLLMHDFENIRNINTDNSKVNFYQGTEGILNIMEDTLTSREFLRAYATLEELKGISPNYFTKYYQRRVEKGISVKSVYPGTFEAYYHKLRDKSEMRESRLVPLEYDFHLDILIYDNKVAITSLTEKFGILIENQKIADAQKKIFDLMWKSSKKYDLKITRRIKKLLSKRPHSSLKGALKSKPISVKKETI